MTVETALYPTQLNTSLPTSSDMVSEGDDQLRLVKTVVKTTFGNVAGAITASQIELNYTVGVTSPIQGQLNGKGSIAGQTWGGAHVFSGTVAVPTLAQGTSTTGVASAAFVQAEWATRLPNYTVPITASSVELNRIVGLTSSAQGQLNAKGAIAGQAWSGTHDFTAASITVSTQAAGTSNTTAASTAFVAATAFTSALPGQTGNANKFVTTDGTNASWSFPVLNPVVITTNTAAVPGNYYIFAAACTLTLPAPSPRDAIGFGNSRGVTGSIVDFGTSNCKGRQPGLMTLTSQNDAAVLLGSTTTTDGWMEA